jgi:hypothetical protein
MGEQTSMGKALSYDSTLGKCQWWWGGGGGDGVGNGVFGMACLSRALKDKIFQVISAI